MASGTNAQMVVTIALLFGVVMESPDVDAKVGVCYDRGVNLPPPAEVVELYRQHNIGRMRIYSPDTSTFEALRRSNIELTLGIPGEEIKRLASNASTADDWVRSNVLAYWPDVRFRYIVVGYRFLPQEAEAPLILPAMRNVYGAISSAGLQNSIKVSTAVPLQNGDVLVPSYSTPSAGEFTDAARKYMVPIVQFLASTGAPLLANVYPYFTYVNYRDISLPYALFTAPGSVVSDPPYSYRNLFDAIVDSLYAALEKVGGPNVTIVVSESGWPSAGGTVATVDNAQTYNQNLIRHAPLGTPRRPGRAIETYVFTMFNGIPKANETGPNFGLFYPNNKQPVYNISF